MGGSAAAAEGEITILLAGALSSLGFQLGQIVECWGFPAAWPEPLVLLRGIVFSSFVVSKAAVAPLGTTFYAL